MWEKSTNKNQTSTTNKTTKGRRKKMKVVDLNLEGCEKIVVFSPEWTVKTCQAIDTLRFSVGIPEVETITSTEQLQQMSSQGIHPIIVQHDDHRIMPLPI